MTSKITRERPLATIPECDDDRLPGIAQTIRRYRTADLIGDCPWIVIEHRSDEYRLRITRLGKLILTK